MLTNSEMVKNLWKDPEYRKRQSEAHKGNPGYWTGKKRYPETIIKMSQAAKNHPENWFKKGHPDYSSYHFPKGHIPWSKGKKFSKEYREKISLAHKGKMMGQNHPNWKGGKTFHSKDGYVLVYSPDHPFRPKSRNRIFEHRLVVEQYLNRYLRQEERVHHLNGMKDDNRLENLILFPNESEHQKYHHKLKLHTQLDKCAP